MKYRNIGMAPKTFYNVTFNPGEIHDVPGFINCGSFVRVPDSEEVSEPRHNAAKTDAEKPKSATKTDKD